LAYLFVAILDFDQLIDNFLAGLLQLFLESADVLSLRVDLLFGQPEKFVMVLAYSPSEEFERFIQSRRWLPI
jgi:hypothetical protein